MSDAYKDLSAYMKEIELLGIGTSILHWDMETVMPEKGAAQRGATLGILSRITHDWVISDKTKKLLKAAHKIKGLNEIQLRNLELWQLGYDRATKIPSEFVEKFYDSASKDSQCVEESSTCK